MKQKLQVSQNKALKLTNVLVKTLEKRDFENYEKIVIKMENYIKIKGSMPLGPLIQYTKSYVNENGELDIKVFLLRQSINYIHNVEDPYKMEPTLSIKNCLYARYTGEESKLKFTYDKLYLLAFEEDIPLKGDSYTIFVDKQDHDIIADVFMEKAE